jgi:excisionase family DNA binding protein
MRNREIMDVEDAATYLGIKKVSLEAAAMRGRIGYVQIGYKKLFTKADCDDYLAKTAKGRFSQLTYKRPEIIERLDPEEVLTVQ